jgi:hypothetical protein
VSVLTSTPLGGPNLCAVVVSSTWQFLHRALSCWCQHRHVCRHLLKTQEGDGAHAAAAGPVVWLALCLRRFGLALS